MMSNEIFKFMQAENKFKLDLYIYSNVRGGFDYEPGEGLKKSETSAKFFAEKLAEYQDVKEINIHINSAGGVISEGTAIRNLLKQHKAKVTAYIEGWACSIASVIATAADEVIMYKNSMQYLHQAWTSIDGNADCLRKEADALDKMTDSAIECYAEKCSGKTDKETIRKIVKNETWLTAQECFELGLCDRVEQKNVSGVLQMLSDIKNYEMSADMSGRIDELITKLENSTGKHSETPDLTAINNEKTESIFREFLKL